MLTSWSGSERTRRNCLQGKACSALTQQTSPDTVYYHDDEERIIHTCSNSTLYLDKFACKEGSRINPLKELVMGGTAAVQAA